MIPLDADDPARQSCTPAAIVHGEGVLASALQAELLGRGLRGEATKACPAVLVNLVEDRGELRLEILDPDGRAAYRTAPTVGVAAAFVESWTRSDLLAPLLAEKAAAAPVKAAEVIATVAPVEAPLPFAARALLEPAMALGAGGGLLGGTLAACWRVGEACFGLDGSYRQSLPSDEEAAPRLLFRTVDAHLTAELAAARFGDGTVRPSIGLGVGRVEALRLAEGGTVPAAVVSPRVRMGTELDWAVADSLSVSLGVSAELLIAAAEGDDAEARGGRASGPVRQPSLLAGLRLGARWGTP